jgi:hypothetical protein
MSLGQVDSTSAEEEQEFLPLVPALLESLYQGLEPPGRANETDPIVFLVLHTPLI